MDKKSSNKLGNKGISFQFKREGFESNLSPFQRTVGSTESTLPKFHTNESEKKYLQSASASVEDEDLYDPLNPTEEVEPVKEPPKKKKKRRTYENLNFSYLQENSLSHLLLLYEFHLSNPS